MSYQLCRHIRTNGRRCQAPSLTDKVWCYFHQHLHASHKGFRHDQTSRAYLIPGQHLELHTLEDRESVQLALSVVINALATGQLDPKRATALLYGLQVASNNAADLDSRPGSDAVRTVDLSPEGLDLAEPAVHEPAIVSPSRAADKEDEEQDDDDFYSNEQDDGYSDQDDDDDNDDTDETPEVATATGQEVGDIPR